MYDLDGKLIDVLWDGTAVSEIPKGIARFDSFSFAVLIDGVDRIARLNITNKEMSTIATNANLTGTLYQLAYDSNAMQYYAIEGNTIEAFTQSGNRIGNPFIAATVGTCVLSTPRGLFVGSANRLLVANTGNNRLNIYNVGNGTVSSCTSFNSNFDGIQPLAVLEHSNGLIYVAGNASHVIYSLPNDGTGTPTVVWEANTAIIRNPTALLEMPDGTILVASDQTNSIERITTDGTHVGGTSFIRDAFTGVVTQMLLIGGD